MITLFKMYKHINNTDVAFFPIKSINSTLCSITYYGHWFNIVDESRIPFKIQEDTITIKKDDIKNWKYYEYTKK